MGKLDKEVKKNWLSALRSGEYKKGIGRLQNGFSFKEGRDHCCCLGVLCCITPGVTVQKLSVSNEFTYKNDSTTHNLPTPLKKDLHISDKQHLILVELNDKNNTWDQVIRYISRNM